VYVVIAEPPVAPPVKATSARPLLYARPLPTLVAVPIVGTCGTDIGVVDADAPDEVDTPLAFVAVTV
jgi:hypothetical protein